MAHSERRLSAILHADLAGFVRLVEAEEDLTFAHLRSARDKSGGQPSKAPAAR